MATAIGKAPMLTCDELANEWRVSVDKIVSFIRSGELQAFDLSTEKKQKKRYRISRDCAERFLASRAITPPPPKPRRRNGKRTASKEWF